MSSQPPDRKAIWQPPARPEWVQRINDEGACMDIRGVVPLDEASLLATATKNTGLSDFGDDSWREPFQVFVRSLDEEADLTLMGRLMGRSDILVFLEARLRVEDAYKCHPEIDDEPIKQPLFITGLPRSGTSILHQLLAQIPENGAPRCWEAIFPCPPPKKADYTTDPRIQKADRLLRQNFRVTPEYESAYQMGGNLPTECIQLMSLSFVSLYWLASLGQVDSYFQYIMSKGEQLFKTAYLYHKRVLKLLQWRNPRDQWVLKSPAHLDSLPSLFAVYPDARVVWSHRDPVKAFASAMDLVGLLQYVRTDHPLRHGVGSVSSIESVALMLRRPVEWMEQGVVPAAKIYNTIFRDFTENPISAVEKIYDYFRMTMSAEGRVAMQRYMESNPREKRGHIYSAGPDELVSRERQELRPYQERFGVPSEA